MNYHNILKCDMLNGEGLRVILFVSGCSNHCPGCHNPQTWDSKSGIEFDDNAFNEVLNSLEPDYISGITFSGGDPMHEGNIDEVLRIIKAVRARYRFTKNIWVYTGYTFEYLKSRDLVTKSILEMSNVLVDGRFLLDQKDRELHYRGSRNQRIIDIQKSLLSDQVVTIDL
jgi:anaerobic ribonucleoside-triphosphate reductase activating protein